MKTQKQFRPRTVKERRAFIQAAPGFCDTTITASNGLRPHGPQRPQNLQIEAESPQPAFKGIQGGLSEDRPSIAHNGRGLGADSPSVVFVQSTKTEGRPNSHAADAYCFAYISKQLRAAVIFFFFAVCSFADSRNDLAILAEAYPNAFQVIDGKGVRFPGGEFIPYDDNEEKDYAALFDRPDIEDMLKLDYPLGETRNPPAKDFDPGRFRPVDFFRALYGKDEKEIRAVLRPVIWMPKLGGRRLLVTTRFGVDKKLEKIIAELEALCGQPSGNAYRDFLVPPGGSFNFRPIAGTNRLSAHSFGIAVDIAVPRSHYWRWEKNGAAEYRNSIPYKIVEIFEKHGFIWGGKWYHFDTMHFEYRPELLLKAQKLRDSKRAPRGGL